MDTDKKTTGSKPADLGRAFQIPEIVMWEDLKEEGKIERLREEIKKNKGATFRRIEELERVIRKLENHSHNMTGDIVIPLRRDSGFGVGALSESCRQREDGKSYF